MVLPQERTALDKAGISVTVYLWGTQDLEKRFAHAARLGAARISTDQPLARLPLIQH